MDHGRNDGLPKQREKRLNNSIERGRLTRGQIRDHPGRGGFFFVKNIARFTRATSDATTLLGGGGGWELYLIKPPEAG